MKPYRFNERRLVCRRTFILLLLTFFFFFSSRANSSEINSRVIEGNIRKNGSFSQSLTQGKIPLRWINLIVAKLEPSIDFRRMKGGAYRFIADEKGELLKFTYKVGPTEIYEIERDLRGEYAARKSNIPLETRLERVSGEIHSSLSRAIKAAGEKSSLASAFAEILIWDIDFAKDVKKGDRFIILVEKNYKGDQFIKYGIIQAVEYRRGQKIIRGVRFQDNYYDEQGVSLGKVFLKVPLRYDYVSSGFNPKRKHPIMGGIHPHLGIDYAAPIGTPVRAVADGFVVSFGRVEGYGKQVILRHPNGYMSYYSHLSRYGPRLKAGRKVDQKQLIGYVGSTGFSTGPHLDYRVSKHGKFIDPAKETFPSGHPLAEKDLEVFHQKKNELLVCLKEKESS